jgi:hypothetical protein
VKTREGACPPGTTEPRDAVTHYSQQVEDYDRATELEVLGGRLIELPAGEWRTLAEAA